MFDGQKISRMENEHLNQEEKKWHNLECAKDIQCIVLMFTEGPPCVKYKYYSCPAQLKKF